MNNVLTKDDLARKLGLINAAGTRVYTWKILDYLKDGLLLDLNISLDFFLKNLMMSEDDFKRARLFRGRRAKYLLEIFKDDIN